MASTVESFNTKIVGSKGRILDFVPVISSAGAFSSINDFAVILNSWNNILLTQTRTYMSNPDYGSDLYKYIFEPADQVTIEAIKEEIRFRLMKYDNRASISEINVAFLSDGHGFVIEIGVEYEDKAGTLNVNIYDKQLLDFES
jgi:phage baseplate assembly protein W